jgi:hypothetical protein
VGQPADDLCGLGWNGAAPASLPPSIASVTPVTKEAASERSQVATAATSSGDPIRRIRHRQASHPLCFFAGVLRALGEDRPRRERVDANPLFRVVERRDLRQPGQAVLCRDVAGKPGDGFDACGRGHVDDRSPPVASIAGISCLRATKTPRRLTAKRTVEVARGDVCKRSRRVPAASGIVDGEVEPPERRGCRFDEMLDGVLVGHIDRNDEGAAAGAFDLAGNFRERILVAGGERHRGSLGRKRLGGCSTDAATSTGDDSHLSFELTSVFGHLRPLRFSSDSRRGRGRGGGGV